MILELFTEWLKIIDSEESFVCESDCTGHEHPLFWVQSAIPFSLNVRFMFKTREKCLIQNIFFEKNGDSQVNISVF